MCSRLWAGASRVARGPRGFRLRELGVREGTGLAQVFELLQCVADLVRDPKANSSAWVHEAFLEHTRFAWQAGYGAFAVSKSNVEAVKACIARQEEHHAKQDYRDEFREFLTRHELEWDERYVWD